MICPNKNSPEWKALVATYGEALALIKFRQQEQNNNFESDFPWPTVQCYTSDS